MNTARITLLLTLVLTLVCGCQPGTAPSAAPTVGQGDASALPPEATGTAEASSTPTDAEKAALESPLAPGDGESGIEDTTLLSPLPTPDSALQPLVVPAPSSDDVGVVTGYLLGGNPPVPVTWGIIYLGSVVTGNDGTPLMVSTDKSTAPSTVVQAAGQFAFTDVPPGSYALVLDLVSSTVILRDPQDGADLLFEVGGGEVTDVGKLVYSDMPTYP